MAWQEVLPAVSTIHIQHRRDSLRQGPPHRRWPAPSLALGLVVALGCTGRVMAQDVQLAEASRPAIATTGGIARLQWLAGCWASERGEPGSGEQWTAPAGGTMLGTSRTIKGGRTIEYEFVVIREDTEHTLAYVAHPSGQAMTAFALARLADREVTFENPAHDFPQRIGYRLDATGKTLLAWIEGTRDGRARRVEFPLVRTPCDPAPAGIASAGSEGFRVGDPADVVHLVDAADDAS